MSKSKQTNKHMKIKSKEKRKDEKERKRREKQRKNSSLGLADPNFAFGRIFFKILLELSCSDSGDYLHNLPAGM